MYTYTNTNQPEVLPVYTIYTPVQKWIIATVVSVAATLSAFASNIYFPSLPQIAHDLSISIDLVNLTVTCYMIFQGLSPTIWAVLADAKGRRITYFCTLVIFLGACIGMGETRSYAQLMVLRCVQSTGSASTIALGSGVIGDITKREERGGYIGFFQGGVLIPVAIGPVIGGVLADRLGWRSVFWFLVIYGAVCFMLIAIVLPETLRSLVGNGSRKPSGFVAKSVLGSYQRKVFLSQQQAPVAQEEPASAKKLDLLSSIKILSHFNTFAAVVLVAVHYAVWQMVLTALSTIVSKTYHTSVTQTGLIFLANGVGSIIGTILIGRMLDYDYRRTLRKYNGQEDQVPIEHTRLRTVWFWSALECASVLAFGWTVDRKVHLSVPIVMLVILGWAAISIQSAVSTLLVDIHHSKSASATASLNLIRCLLGAGGTAVIGPLITAMRIGWSFTLLAGVMLLLSGLVYVQLVVRDAARGTRTDKPLGQARA